MRRGGVVMIYFAFAFTAIVFMLVCLLVVMQALDADQLVAVTNYCARFTVRVDVIAASYDADGDMQIETIIRSRALGEWMLSVWLLLINLAYG